MLKYFSINPLDGETHEDFVERQGEITKYFDEHKRRAEQIRRENINKLFFVLMMITLLAIILGSIS